MECPVRDDVADTTPDADGDAGDGGDATASVLDPLTAASLAVDAVTSSSGGEPVPSGPTTPEMVRAGTQSHWLVFPCVNVLSLSNSYVASCWFDVGPSCVCRFPTCSTMTMRMRG